jgi:hypothetical protein
MRKAQTARDTTARTDPDGLDGIRCRSVVSVDVFQSNVLSVRGGKMDLGDVFERDIVVGS